MFCWTLVAAAPQAQLAGALFVPWNQSQLQLHVQWGWQHCSWYAAWTDTGSGQQQCTDIDLSGVERCDGVEPLSFFSSQCPDSQQ